MLVNKDKLKFGIGDILLLAVTVFYLIGATVIFPSKCMEDMACHKANTVVIIIAAAAFCAAVVHFLVPNLKIKAAIGAVICAAAIVSVFVPGGIMPICAMDQMSCVTALKPGVTVTGIITAVVAAIDICISLLSGKGRGVHRDEVK